MSHEVSKESEIQLAETVVEQMENHEPGALSRRGFVGALGAVGAVAAGGLLAACSGDDDDTATEDSDPSAPATTGP